MKKIYRWVLWVVLWTAFPAWAEVPTILTDTISKGDGIIDLFRDVTGSELNDSLSSGTLFLGVDLNEAVAGIEKSTSQGVAIKQIELAIRSTDGDFTFSDFYTNTASLIQEVGTTEAQMFQTLFGATGSSNITGGTTGFDLSQFDDVIELRNISVTGDILSAQLKITFLDTAKAGFNEEFFDFSAGFEEFAILTKADAQILESANIGLTEAPQDIKFDLAVADTGGGGDLSSPSGAPEPSWFLLLALPALLFWRGKQRA